MQSSPPTIAASTPPATTVGGLDSRALNRRLWRNGVIVVGASVAASVMLTVLALESDAEPDLFTMVLFAVLIPLVVAPCAYGWIA